MTYVVVGVPELAIAASMLFLAGLISVALQLGLTRSLAIAALRMSLQLTVMGLVLTWLFAVTSPLWTALAAVLMIGFAGREVMARQDRRLSGVWAHGIDSSGMAIASAMTTVLALGVVLQPDPWFHPRYSLPLLGMILGNGMTGVALGLRTLTNNIMRDRVAIEARLMLGHSRAQALGETVREALRMALMPTINAMSAAGIVFLPGMMTGQILAGVPPEQAVRYQVLIYFLISGSTALGAVVAVLGSAYRLTDARHRLRLDRLTAPK